MKDVNASSTTVGTETSATVAFATSTPATALPQKRDSPATTSTTTALKKAAVSAAAIPQPALRVVLTSVDAKAPSRGSELSAGYDLSASEPAVIAAKGGRAIVKTGLKIAIPQGCYGRVAPRSGLAVKKGIDVGAGVIDADYRGEVGVVLFNFGDDPFEVNKGDRVAQLILERIATPDVQVVETLDDTERGAGGFGSTGVSAEKKN